MISKKLKSLEPSFELIVKSIEACSCGISIADAGLPDNPLIYVNQAFERMTGYLSQEVLGKNCRFLQGESADEPPVAEIREAIAEGRGCTTILKNYRKDGTPFWNELIISPVLSPLGQTTHFIGVQTDVTRREEAERLLREAHEILEHRVEERTAELRMSYDATLEGWGKALELRDQETKGHSQRVTAMTLRLAVAMGVSEDELVHIRRGALLHDIGKIGVPDRILLKPDKLADEEREIMQQHPVFAYEWLSTVEYLRPALDIPYSHHEKWDGSGYPLGLKGEEIPYAARLFAVVDVWDALRSDRPYRKGWPEHDVITYIENATGSHFDPAIASVFVSILRSDLRNALPKAMAA